MPTTLIAVSGISPAILTETLWALACETPAIVPDNIVVITTSKGERDIENSLLTKQKSWGNKTVWETLRSSILNKTKLAQKSKKLQLSVRVIELPDETRGVRQKAADLRTREHNDEAADFIIQTLAPYADAEDQRVIASIAGGRKTMGALLYAAMSLLGKETDRVTHVLVNEPFETCREFFYPNQPVQNLEAKPPGKSPVTILAKNAMIELADIPFVPLRNKFTELNEPRRSFEGLVATYSKAEHKSFKGKPRVTLDEEQGILSVENRPISLKGRDLLVCVFLFQRALAGKPHFLNKDEAGDSIKPFNTDWKTRHPFHQATARLSAAGISVDDIPKALAALRKKLTNIGLSAAIPYLAPERDRIGFDIQKE